MSRAGTVLLSLGVVLFIALLGWQGFGSVAAALAAAGWGLLAVAAFHLLPVVIDALAIETLFPRNERDVSLRDALFARWTGESVNSLMPAGQIGGPMLMVRYLSQRGMRARDAAAVITVSTTMQSVGQMIFAMIGLALLSSYASGVGMLLPVLVVIVVCSLMVIGFFFAQRKGLFARATRFASQFAARSKPSDRREKFQPALRQKAVALGGRQAGCRWERFRQAPPAIRPAHPLSVLCL